MGTSGADPSAYRSTAQTIPTAGRPSNAGYLPFLRSRPNRSGVRFFGGRFASLGRFPFGRRLLFRGPPFLHRNRKCLSSRVGDAAFLDGHLGLGRRSLRCRHRSRNRSWCRRSSLRRPYRRPTLLCPCDNRPPARRAHLPFRQRGRTYALRRLRVRLDRRQCRLSTGTRRFLCYCRPLKGFDRYG